MNNGSGTPNTNGNGGHPRINGRFVKGNKEGNRYKKGQSGNQHGKRLKTHLDLTEMVQRIGSELVERETKTRIERMVRRMFERGTGADRAMLLERGWGRVPNEVRFKTWRDEVLELMRQGLITAEVVRRELPEPEANQLIAMAGFAVMREGEKPEVIDGQLSPSQAEPGAGGGAEPDGVH